jgi:hypothetical protein
LRIQEACKGLLALPNSVGCEPEASVSFQRKLSAPLG